MRNKASFQINTLSAAIASTLISGYATAQQSVLEEVIVTATRRAESVQDIPLNITALGSDMIQRERLSNLSDIARRVPGMSLVDQGPRGGNTLTVRGLSADPISSPETTIGNGGGGTVGTYVGEVPLYIDLELNDMERVEVLIGPQGTLYGAGTLGGAVRYLPNKPHTDGITAEVRGDAYDLSESGDLGYELGATVNIPLIDDRLAFRASLDYTDDPGFIDYDYLVREAGVSDPEPDFSDPAAVEANLTSKDDVNTDETWSGRAALRYMGDRIDGTLSYYYQDSDIGGRQQNHKSAFGTDDYVSAHRFEEPIDRENELYALEIVADLGFAELTSATGYSEYSEDGQRDQTDLLLNVAEDPYYYYELFPRFSAFTSDKVDEDTFTQELRLVSTAEGPWNWIVGGFYSNYQLDQLYREFTPNFDVFWVENLGGLQTRPDSLEYYSTRDSEETETAVFGELGYQLTDKWQVTVGARWFDYDVDEKGEVAFPLFDTVFYGEPQDSILPSETNADYDDDDVIFKFNTSYDINEDMMTYFTVSEGYRLGGVNPIPPCGDDREGQSCALPDERIFVNDTTVNYELGLRSQFGDNLILNGSLFYVDWDDVQLANFTVNGAEPITSNGEGARSMGVELSGQWYITDSLYLLGSYSYTDAELTDDVPCMLGSYLDADGLLDIDACYSDPDGIDPTAYDGDRLPGTPEHQGYLSLNYAIPLNGGNQVEFDWSATYTSDVLTKVGERNFGESLDSYTLHNVSATWFTGDMRVSLYADNVFDEYAETGVRLDSSFIGSVGDFTVRRYFHNVARPRQVGLRFVYNFEN